jgi:hypothetical protein
MVHHVMIGLDRDSSNVSNFKQWGKQNDRNIEFIPGVRLSSSLHYSKQYLTPYGYYNMHNWRETSSHFDSVGPVGCFLAHRTAWEACCRVNEPTWIFEEGVISYNTELFNYIDNRCEDFDLVLGHTVKVLRMWRQRRIPSEPIIDCHRHILKPIDKIYYGTKCYRVSPTFARQLLIDSVRFDVHVDTFISSMAIYHANTFQCVRTSTGMVTAKSSHRIRHTLDHSLFLICYMVICVVISVVIIIVMYLRCGNRNRMNT